MSEPSPDTIILSDTHLGSRFSRTRQLVDFLEALPDGAGLVLNGDIVDVWRIRSDTEAQDCLARIVAESRMRRVVWVRGNNDRHYFPQDPGNIEFCENHAIGKRLYIAHGDRFDIVLRYSRIFLVPLRGLLRVANAMSSKPRHNAAWARLWPLAHRTFCRQVASTAMKFATRSGFAAVCCGHTHEAEEIHRGGMHYLNTGAWTEEVPHYVLVKSDGTLELRPATQPII